MPFPFSSGEILTAANLNAALVSVHSTMPADVGLGNVVNLDQRNASNITLGTLGSARLPAFSGGDITSIAGSAALSLVTVNTTVGTFGDAQTLPRITVDAKGRITSVVAQAINGTLTGVGLKNYTEIAVVNATAGATPVITLGNGNATLLTLTTNAIVSFSGAPIAGKLFRLTVVVQQDATGGRTITWPGSVVWNAGTTPTVTSAPNSYTVFVFYSFDGGTTWVGFSPGSGSGGGSGVTSINGLSGVVSFAAGNLTNGAIGTGPVVLKHSPTVDQSADATTALKILRFTDTTPSGNYIACRNAADSGNVFAVDVSGAITIGSMNATLLTGTLAAGRFPALTGDATTVAGSLAVTLATVNSTVGTYGDASNVPVVTVDGKGRVTGVTLAPIAGGSGSGTKTYARFTALDNHPPATNYAQIATRNGLTVVLAFDASTVESAVFTNIVPEGSVFTGGVTVNLYWTAQTATTGAVVWGVEFEKTNTTLNTFSFATQTTVTTTTSATVGVPNKTTFTVSAGNMDGIVAGDLFRMRIQRLASNAGDTMTADAELVCVEVRGV